MKKLFVSLIGWYLLVQGAFSQPASAKKNFDASLVPPDAFVFYVIGDWGRKGKYFQKDVASAMDRCAEKVKPNMIISTGDNFYTFGVKSTKDKQWKKSFENIYNGEHIKDVVWYAVLGNHDHYGNEQAQIDYSQTHTRWKLPAEYYSFSTHLPGSEIVDFVFINTQRLLRPKSAKALTQWKWIDSTLSTSRARWKFVVGHHPVYSSNPLHGDTKILIEQLKPVLEKHSVDAYFCGHDHDLQHQQPSGSRVDYFVSGAGSSLRPTASYEHTKFAQSVAGFAVVAISHNQLFFWFIDKDDNIIYRYQMQK
jgi:hypothetical protein